MQEKEKQNQNKILTFVHYLIKKYVLVCTNKLFFLNHSELIIS